MKKHIDKLCLHGDNIITLIKHFIKHKIKQHEKEETIMLQQDVYKRQQLGVWIC